MNYVDQFDYDCEQLTKISVNKLESKLITNVKNTFDIDVFIRGLSKDLQIKFDELLNNETSLTNAILILVKDVYAKDRKSINNQTTKITVSDEIKNIVVAIMEYNSNQSINTNCVVPTYALINKISERYLTKSLAKVTVDSVLKSLNKDITTIFNKKGITELDIKNWNGKYHRKTLKIFTDNIINYLIQKI